MKRILFALGLVAALVSPAHAQKTKSQLTTEINTNFPDNTTGAITPAILRTTTTDIVNNLSTNSCNVRGSGETSYNVVAADNGGCVVVTNTTAIETITLPNAATSLPFVVTIIVAPGQVTSATQALVASGGGSIANQIGPITVPPYASVTFWSDGTNWRQGANVAQPEPGAAGYATYMTYSPSLATAPLGVTITLTSTCAASSGDVISISYHATGFSPNPAVLSHTMTAAASCLTDAAADLLAQYKANTQLQNAYGTDVISYSFVNVASPGSLGLVASRPFVVTGSPSVTYTSGSNTTIAGASTPSTKLQVGAFNSFVRSTKALGDTMLVGDQIGATYYCADNSTTACDPRDLFPVYCQTGAAITSTTPGAEKASFTVTCDSVLLTGSKVGIGPSGSANSLLDVSRNAASVNPVFGGTTVLKVTNVDNTSTAIEAQTFASSGTALASFTGVSAGGTGASPAVTKTGAKLVALDGEGWSGAMPAAGPFTLGAEIAFQATQDWTSTTTGTAIVAKTTPNGSIGSSEAFRVQQGLSVGTTSDPGVGLIYTNSASFVMRSKTSYTDGGGHGTTPTLGTNGPTGATTPTKWLPFDDNGTTRYVPSY